MFKYNKEAMKQLGLSTGRFLWFGVLGLLVAILTGLLTSTDIREITWTVGETALPVGVWIILGVGFAIKAIDRYIHKNDKTKLQGLAPSFLQK